MVWFVTLLKGVVVMTLIPFTDCCTMLGIDPKTLRKWARAAKMSFVAHPSDARSTCLSLEHVQQLALLHARSLPPQPDPLDPASTTQTQGMLPESPGEQSAHLVPPPQADAMQQLAALMATMSTMQEQVAHLAFLLLSESSQRYEQRLTVLEALLPRPLQALAAMFASGQSNAGVLASLSAPPVPLPTVYPAEQRARSRPPLIEYGARGNYVIITAQKGELPIVPGSPEWFEWLATLASFRFVGQLGRFTAYRRYDRHGSPNRSWCAARSLHGQRFEYSIGVTDHLTIERLEQGAAFLQAQLEAL
jgi:hypothetical protein